MRPSANNKKHRGFSLLEVTVSIAIMAIVMVMLNNVIFDLTLAARKSLARSFIREEVTDVIGRIASDIRDAGRVNDCTGSLQQGNVYCEVETSEKYSWEICLDANGVNRICQKNAAGGIIYQTSPTLLVRQFSFDEAYSESGNVARRSILVTISGDHRNSDLGVNNILRQNVVSTRNYILR